MTMSLPFLWLADVCSVTGCHGLALLLPFQCPSLPFSSLPSLWPALRLHVCRSGLSLSLPLSPSLSPSVCVTHSHTRAHSPPSFQPSALACMIECRCVSLLCFFLPLLGLAGWLAAIYVCVCTKHPLSHQATKPGGREGEREGEGSVSSAGSPSVCLSVLFWSPRPRV